MTPRELQIITRKHRKLTVGIIKLFETDGLPPAEAEALLLYLAGLSAGQAQVPCNGQDWLSPIAIGWAFAAEHAE